MIYTLNTKEKLLYLVNSLLGKCFVLLGLISLAQAGCASFPTKSLPSYSYDQIHSHNPKPSIDYDAHFMMLGNENAAGVKAFQEEIDKVFAESQFFSKFSPGIGTERYHLSLIIRNEGNLALGFLSGFISGLTFGIIPAYGKDDYILSVDVKRDCPVSGT